MSGKKQASADNLNPLPSYLKITRAPSWARLNEIPPWPELYREVWLVNERRWCDPATHQPLDLPLHNRMWDMFKRAADLVIRDLASIPWDRVPSSDPISLYELNLCVQIGILSLAPPDISDPGVRGFLFFDTLIRKAILDHSGVSRMTPKHALAAYVGYRGGPRVEAEMIRRVSKHIGGHAAILKWCFAMYRDNKAGFDFDDTWQASQKRLATFIFWKLARGSTEPKTRTPTGCRKMLKMRYPAGSCRHWRRSPCLQKRTRFRL